MSTSITVTSSLADVLLAFSKITPSTTGWQALTPPNKLNATPAIVPITSWTANIGLFGEDLTTFFADCATVGYTECNPADFAAFSGWAIGTEITVTANLASAE